MAGLCHCNEARVFLIAQFLFQLASIILLTIDPPPEVIFYRSYDVWLPGDIPGCSPDWVQHATTSAQSQWISFPKILVLCKLMFKNPNDPCMNNNSMG